jgi:hypothetical protein
MPSKRGDLEEERAMNKDAFDDVRCPFDYKAELSKARHALDEKVRQCASRDWKIGYRELAKLFNLSPGTLCKIARGWKPKCKPGPRTRQQRNAVKKLRTTIRRDDGM